MVRWPARDGSYPASGQGGGFLDPNRISMSNSGKYNAGPGCGPEKGDMGLSEVAPVRGACAVGGRGWAGRRPAASYTMFGRCDVLARWADHGDLVCGRGGFWQTG